MKKKKNQTTTTTTKNNLNELFGQCNICPRLVKHRFHFPFHYTLCLVSIPTTFPTHTHPHTHTHTHTHQHMSEYDQAVHQPSPAWSHVLLCLFTYFKQLGWNAFKSYEGSPVMVGTRDPINLYSPLSFIYLICVAAGGIWIGTPQPQKTTSKFLSMPCYAFT